RNHFRPEQYFSEHNVSTGVLRSPSGVRLLALPEDLITGLHRGLEDEAGAASSVILYSVGRWWGSQFMKQHEAEIRSFYNRDTKDLPLGFYLHILRRVWGLYGWGSLDLSFDLKEKGFLETIVDEAIYSASVGNIGRPTDHLVSGLLASIVGKLAGRELEAVEISCRSQGDPQCRFLLGQASRIQVVGTWVSQKRAPDDILSAIAGGELV
ncbi:MAG: V4R domain-containing protein, partial [Myxococcota bacterium]